MGITDHLVWNTPKKDVPHLKTKKKPQWDSRMGTIMIKSNPIPARWVTHKLENNNTKEVFPLLQRFWAPRQSSQAGNLTKGPGIPKESDLEGQWDLIIELPQDWGKQRLQSCRAQKNPTHTSTREREQWPHRRLNQNYLLALEGLLCKCGLAVAQHRDGYWQQQS